MSLRPSPHRPGFRPAGRDPARRDRRRAPPVTPAAGATWPCRAPVHPVRGCEAGSAAGSLCAAAALGHSRLGGDARGPGRGIPLRCVRAGRGECVVLRVDEPAGAPRCAPFGGCRSAAASQPPTSQEPCASLVSDKPRPPGAAGPTQRQRCRSARANLDLGNRCFATGSQAARARSKPRSKRGGLRLGNHRVTPAQALRAEVPPGGGGGTTPAPASRGGLLGWLVVVVPVL